MGVFLSLRMVMAMNYYPAPHATAEDVTGTNRWRRSRPVDDDQRTSNLFWLTVFGLGCVSLLCVTLAASSALAKKSLEKTLQSTLLLPKLKSSHGERKADASRMSEPVPGELAHPKDRKTTEIPPHLPPVVEQTSALEFPKIPAPTHEPAMADALLSPIPKVELVQEPSLFDICQDPVIFLQACKTHRGDSPMIRNWKTLTLYSLLSAATVVYVPQPSLAGGEPKKDAPVRVEGLDELRTAITELTKRITSLENKKAPETDQDAIIGVIKAEMKKLEAGMLKDLTGTIQGVGAEVQGVKKSVESLQGDINNIKTQQITQKSQLDIHRAMIDQLMEDRKKPVANTTPAIPAVDKTGLDEIRAKLNAIENAIAKLSPTDKRISLSPPTGATANMGRVMLINLSADELLFTVNNASYRLAPRSSKMLDVPAGSLRYEVFSERWKILDRQTTNLTSGETFTLAASIP